MSAIVARFKKALSVGNGSSHLKAATLATPPTISAVSLMPQIYPHVPLDGRPEQRPFAISPNLYSLRHAPRQLGHDSTRLMRISRLSFRLTVSAAPIR